MTYITTNEGDRLMPPDMHAVQGLALISERIWGKGRKKGGGDEVGRKGRGWIMNEERRTHHCNVRVHNHPLRSRRQ